MISFYVDIARHRLCRSIRIQDVKINNLRMQLPNPQAVNPARLPLVVN